MMSAQLVIEKHFIDTVLRRRDTFSTRPQRATGANILDEFPLFLLLSKNLCQTFVWRLVNDASMATIATVGNDQF
jgi:hypothetical protein